MFSRIEKKIVLIIAITISFCTIISSTATYLIIRKNILNNFIPLTIQSAAQQKNNLDLFLDLTAESSKLFTNDPEIVSILKMPHIKNTEFFKIIEKLNDIQASNLNIIGLTLYGMNGVFYPSNSSNATANSTPDLKQILKDPIIQKFIRQPGRNLWFDRFQSDYWITDLTLNLSLYNGVFTFVQKIHDPNGSLLGLLMTDITIDSLYEHFHNSNFNADTYLLTSRRGVLKTPYSKPVNKLMLNEIQHKLNTRTNYSISNDGQNIIIFHPIPYSFDFIIRVIPLANILSKINQLLFFLVLINILLIALALILGVAISRSISWPLGELYTKMQKFIKI